MSSNHNKLKAILDSSNSIAVPGVYDPLSAKLAEINGFSAAWVSGFCVSTSHFVPDENLLTIEKYTRNIGEIREASDIPLIIDCDEGYGNIRNTLNMISSLYNMGIEACCIEDNIFPKTNSFKDKGGDTPLQSIASYCNRINAIKQRFPELILIARTESLIVGESIQQAVERASEYQRAGADLIVIHSKSVEREDFENIATHWGNPGNLVVIPTKSRDLSFSDFSQMGYKVVILANQLLRNNISTMYHIYAKMNENCNISDLNEDAVSMDFIFGLVDKYYKGKRHVQQPFSNKRVGHVQ